jgi:midasin
MLDEAYQVRAFYIVIENYKCRVSLWSVTELVLQVLWGRLEHEQHKLQMNTGSKDLSAYADSLASCCLSTPELLCQKSVSEGWQDTFPPADATSLFWDMELLKELSSVPLDELEGLHQVILRTIFYLRVYW